MGLRISLDEQRTDYYAVGVPMGWAVDNALVVFDRAAPVH